MGERLTFALTNAVTMRRKRTWAGVIAGPGQSFTHGLEARATLVFVGQSLPVVRAFS